MKIQFGLEPDMLGKISPSEPLIIALNVIDSELDYLIEIKNRYHISDNYPLQTQLRGLSRLSPRYLPNYMAMIQKKDSSMHSCIPNSKIRVKGRKYSYYVSRPRNTVFCL